jgi:hypothetical protein
MLEEKLCLDEHITRNALIILRAHAGFHTLDYRIDDVGNSDLVFILRFQDWHVRYRLSSHLHQAKFSAVYILKQLRRSKTFPLLEELAIVVRNSTVAHRC